MVIHLVCMLHCCIQNGVNGLFIQFSAAHILTSATNLASYWENSNSEQKYMSMHAILQRPPDVRFTKVGAIIRTFSIRGKFIIVVLVRMSNVPHFFSFLTRQKFYSNLFEVYMCINLPLGYLNPDFYPHTSEALILVK